MADRLSVEEREEISRGLSEGLTASAIARRLGRAPSTVTRELARVAPVGCPPAGRRAAYRAHHGQRMAHRARQRRRPRRLVVHAELRALVLAGLARRWSPEQIAAWLRTTFPDRPELWVSHETIYQAIYLQGRGSLRAALADQVALRSGRTRRRAQGRAVATNRPWVDLNIAQRPAEAADRAVPGHWEGDCIIGKDKASAVATLVERTTRYLMLVALPGGRVSEHVVAQLAAKMTTLPEHLRRSLTWDQGSEMAAHARFTIATGAPVYFCDPRSPWQRGTNENTNGLLRQYLPKGTDLSTWTQDQLDAIAHEMNGRPRKTLGWKNPAQALDELLVASPA